MHRLMKDRGEREDRRSKIRGTWKDSRKGHCWEGRKSGRKDRKWGLSGGQTSQTRMVTRLTANMRLSRKDCVFPHWQKQMTHWLWVVSEIGLNFEAVTNIAAYLLMVLNLIIQNDSIGFLWRQPGQAHGARCSRHQVNCGHGRWSYTRQNTRKHTCLDAFWITWSETCDASVNVRLWLIACIQSPSLRACISSFGNNAEVSRAV